MTNSDKSYTWTCKDYSENELTTETFALRFKTTEIALDFKEVADVFFPYFARIPKTKQKFESSCLAVASLPVKPTSASAPLTTAASGFGDQFRPAAGSWECNACMLRNDANVNRCLKLQL
jgi:E3 SUMO-protein ligase RanBP2